MKSSGNLFSIALYLLVETMCWHSIQLGRINIDHDLVATNQVDSALDELNGNCEIVRCEFLCVRHMNTLTVDAYRSHQ